LGMKPKILVYTHTDVDWVWPYWFKQTDKYLSDYDKIMLVNDPSKVDREDYQVVSYSDKNKYTERFVEALDKLHPEEVVILHHEDMFLYDTPNYTVIEELSELVKEDKAHFIKLIRLGEIRKAALHESLSENPLNLMFAIQPTICKVKNLRTVYAETPGDTIWQFEANSSDTMIENEFSSYYTFTEGEKLRGMAHYDSTIYPYVATAVVKGEWNVLEYAAELGELFKEKEYEDTPSYWSER
jgi:hypothetical protein